MSDKYGDALERLAEPGKKPEQSTGCRSGCGTCANRFVCVESPHMKDNCKYCRDNASATNFDKCKSIIHPEINGDGHCFSYAEDKYRPNRNNDMLGYKFYTEFKPDFGRFAAKWTAL